MMMSLSASRVHQPELLDGDSFDPPEYETTLRQLSLINRLTNGYGPTIRAVAEIAMRNPGRALRVLDIGFGYGDTLRALEKWARASGVELELTGIDLNPLAKGCAERAGAGSIRYRVGDVFGLSQSGESYDVMINALFMHHLDDEQIVRLLRWMTERARLAWFINDLHRHAIAYHFIGPATRLFGFNRLIRHDAPLSVARAFRRRDWLRYLDQAGVSRESVRVSWHWAFRYGILCDCRRARGEST